MKPHHRLLYEAIGRIPILDRWRIQQQRRSHLVPVHQPLMLISQVQRSGGTLLSQLLDGVPGVLAHPHELYTGSPTKHDWPTLTPRTPSAEAFSILRETPATLSFLRGYEKFAAAQPETGTRSHPFLLLPSLQRKIFLDVCPDPIGSPRAAFDAYFTSYFNAWLDCSFVYAEPHRWVSAFVPRLRPDSLEAFFETYPDGHFIHIVRDPVSWWASARRHHAVYESPERAAQLWCETVRAGLAVAERRPDSVDIVSFEDLIRDPAGVMTAVSVRLGLAFDYRMCRPTFNGRPIRPDSSFEVGDAVVDVAAADRRADVEERHAKLIEQSCADLHAKAQTVALRRPRRGADPPRNVTWS